MNDETYLQLAIESARRGIAQGQTPFGAVIVRDGEILAKAHNAVWATCDPTAHAEVRAIRVACSSALTIDLSGATIYSTCEPCPMCFAAIHWAKLDRVVFGARIADAQAAGFAELDVSNEQMRELGGSGVKVVGDVLREPCRDLFDEWKSAGQARTY